MEVNVGGDRLGSGAKMQVSLHNYNRSTHNLSKKFQSSLAPGVIYPAYVNIGLNGDKFDIDINSIVRTLPTKGPLFGAFKMQIDCFVAPIRLYHGILHNNPINIGMKMNQVYLPKIKLTSKYILNGVKNLKQINNCNIWKYLGLSGLGRMVEEPTIKENISRNINAVPLLAYYDIFKNYYANKQEDNAYVITQEEKYKQNITSVAIKSNSGNWIQVQANEQGYYGLTLTNNTYPIQVVILGDYLNAEYINVSLGGKRLTLSEVLSGYYIDVREIRQKQNTISFKIFDAGNFEFLSILDITPNNEEYDIYLQPFPLENIDKMREDLLSIKLGEQFYVENTSMYPYKLNTLQSSAYDLCTPLTGLCVKTYQSDMFNNWLKTELITGENGIAEITRVDTTNGLQLDALNLAQKVYNMLNRIAVSGGTYEDWQEAVYTGSTIRKAETPMYMGGYSSEIMFEEVISTANTETTKNGDTELGQLGGRGREVKEKGGNIKFTIEEPSIIMVMVSLTPRITYSQGNKWYLTDIHSIDDLHKPALDGIGYQDLIVEQMAWTGTTIDQNGSTHERLSAGKVPAWLNYMTDINECYGDFADDNGTAFMVLNRNYDIYDLNSDQEPYNLKAPSDITTYIDPKKYNYAFAVNERQAQNFWCEIQFDITARRLMSAKQIPNL